MLTTPWQAPVGTLPRRRAIARSLVWPTARVARLDRVAGTVLVGSIPLFVTVLRNGADLALPSIILGVVTGASVGWVADDPTGDVLTPCPVSVPRRLACRVVMAVSTSLVMAAAVVVAAAVLWSSRLVWAERIPESMFAAVVALAVGFWLLLRGDPGGGAPAVTSGALLPVLVAALAFRWPDVLPTFGPGPTHARWWMLVALGVLAAAHGARDTAAPSLYRRLFEDR